ncbi:MAG: hypothetical protein MSA74_05490, partial [Ruminococcus sp.]|nr:hypothetical protein [Ruminococcus sp.]
IFTKNRLTDWILLTSFSQHDIIKIIKSGMRVEIFSFHQNQKGSFFISPSSRPSLNVHAKNCTVCAFFRQIAELQGIFAI